MRASAGALDGVRVLDLAGESGTYCGKLLADLGADVILVEPPGGTAMRRIGPFYGSAPDAERSLFFWHYNANKRSIILDIETPADRTRLLGLAAGADLVLETEAPGRLEALGLGYAAFAARQPRLSMVSITPFGQTGPYRDHRGSDLIAQAAGGMVYVNGHPGEPPLQGLGLQAYHSAAVYGTIGALLALLAREALGHGQWIDVSIQECVAAAVEHTSSFFHQEGTVARRQGSLHWTRYFRVGRCRDGYVMHCTLGDWTSLLEWVKADGRAQDLVEPAWEDFGYRRDHCTHLFDVLDAWAATYAVADLVDGAQLRRLPYAAVLAPEALPQNPQLRARGFFVPVRHEDIDATVSYPGAPYVFSVTPWQLRRRAPRAGEHTAEVLAEAARRCAAATGRCQTGAPPAAAGAALAGVRVIDFTWVVAGPVATRILADHGAEVIKIERRDALDFGSRRGGLSGNLNRGKQSIVIDMNTPRGVELARQLIATADVVVDNFSARVMRNWNLDYDSLRRLKPDIITVSLSGFGQTGPHRDYVSYGPTLQALSGHTLLMRHPGGEPAGWGFSYSDMAAGASGACAVLAALWHRRRSGQGQHVDLSQFENLVALLGHRLLALLAGVGAWEPTANGSQELAAAPHGVYRCADAAAGRDRWCAIAVRTDAEWRRFAGALADPPWTRDPQLAGAAGRVARRADIDAHTTAWTRGHSAEEVMTRLQAVGVPASVVADAEDLCRRDQHLRARGYWQRIPSPEGAAVECDGVPLKMSATPGAVRGPGPLLGEHTDAVLHTLLGLPRETITTLRAAGIVA